MKSGTQAVAVLSLTVALLSPQAQARSLAECDAAWKKLDQNEDGAVVAGNAAPYIADLKAAKALEQDTTILTTELFMKGCTGDLFKTAMPPPASGQTK